VEVQITHPEKVLFPEAGVTKADLAGYYADVASVILPHVRGRPISMQVFHGGVGTPGHFMKQAPGHFPDWIERVTVPKKGGTVTHVVANRPETLPYLAGQNVITPHVWTSRADRLDRPDRLVLDLDPSGGLEDFPRVRAAAALVGELYRESGLEPFAMLTGSRGIHVVAPIRRELEFPEVFALARALAAAAVERSPDELTTEFHKDKREDRIFVDDLRNRWAQTVVPPYAVRALPEASVATPLRWEELDDADLAPRAWTVHNIGERLAGGGDQWADIAAAATSPRSAAKKVPGTKG
jgi:bifunctional non-homologous end joining protein LigD